MSERKAFLLRVDPALLESMQRWANDDLRSLNAQIEFVLRRALQREGRPISSVPPPANATADPAPDGTAAATMDTNTGADADGTGG